MNKANCKLKMIMTMGQNVFLKHLFKCFAANGDILKDIAKIYTKKNLPIITLQNLQNFADLSKPQGKMSCFV